MNNAQLELLNSLIGLEGIYFEVIKEEESIDTGTKILYLERAINEDCQTFLNSLDKLYQHKSNIDLIRALKTINDLFFNNEIKNSIYGVKPALKHWFGGLGGIENVDTFKKVIEELVHKSLTVISEGKKGEEIEKQKENRISSEKTIEVQRDWRTQIDLPCSQLYSEPLSGSSALPQALVINEQERMSNNGLSFLGNGVRRGSPQLAQLMDSIRHEDLGLNIQELLTILGVNQENTQRSARNPISNNSSSFFGNSVSGNDPMDDFYSDESSNDESGYNP